MLNFWTWSLIIFHAFTWLSLSTWRDNIGSYCTFCVKACRILIWFTLKRFYYISIFSFSITFGYCFIWIVWSHSLICRCWRFGRMNSRGNCMSTSITFSINFGIISVSIKGSLIFFFISWARATFSTRIFTITTGHG